MPMAIFSCDTCICQKKVVSLQSKCMAYILNKEDLASAMLVLKKALEAYNLEK